MWCVKDLVVPRIKLHELLNRIASDCHTSIIRKHGCGSLNDIVVSGVVHLEMCRDTVKAPLVAPTRLSWPRRDVEQVFPDRAAREDVRVDPKEHVVAIVADTEDVLLDVVADGAMQHGVLYGLQGIKGSGVQNRRVRGERIPETTEV